MRLKTFNIGRRLRCIFINKCDETLLVLYFRFRESGCMETWIISTFCLLKLRLYDPLFLVALRFNTGHVLLIHEVSRSHTTLHHSRQDSSGRVISSTQSPLLDKTQYSRQTDIYARGGIRNHNLSRRWAANPRLRQRGHWDRLVSSVAPD